MKSIITTLLGLLLAGAAHAADHSLKPTVPITPEMQATIDAQKKAIAEWAADTVLLAAVKAQNEKGPIPGMNDNAWKAAKPDDAVVQAFETNAAGVLLTAKVKASDGLYSEAFLNAAKGEKVAFVGKTTRYIHAGKKKFDVPMGGQQWQGKPEFDESSQKLAIQISTPVFDNGKPIGVLVVGLSLKKLETK